MAASQTNQSSKVSAKSGRTCRLFLVEEGGKEALITGPLKHRRTTLCILNQLDEAMFEMLLRPSFPILTYTRNSKYADHIVQIAFPQLFVDYSLCK